MTGEKHRTRKMTRPSHTELYKIIVPLFLRIDALKRSKSALGFNATYGAYLNIFVENHKAKGALKCAEKIVMQLGATGIKD